MLDPKIPDGPLKNKWALHKSQLKSVLPSMREKYTVIIVGAGLSGCCAAAAISCLGFKVKLFYLQDSPLRCQGFSSQELIPYPCNETQVQHFFSKTISEGDFRSREADVYRLAELTKPAVDLYVAQGVPFERDEAGYPADCSLEKSQDSCLFTICRQTKQQILLGAYRTLMQSVAKETVELYPRQEMLDLVIVNDRAKGIVTRNLQSGAIESHTADAVILATGGYANIFYHSTNGQNSNATALWQAHKRGALWANPSFIQFHPACIPIHNDYQSKTIPVISSFNDYLRLWVPKKKGNRNSAKEVPEHERDYFLEKESKRASVPSDMASRRIKEQIDAGNGIGPNAQAVYFDFPDGLIKGDAVIKKYYQNFIRNYEQITGQKIHQEPLMVTPAPHYSIGGLWVDYHLMTTIQGLFAIGEANFSSHGAHPVEANTILQSSVDGCFIVPYSISDYLARTPPSEGNITNLPAFKQAEARVAQKINRLLSVKGKQTVKEFHKQLGKSLWDHCGIIRDKVNLDKASMKIPEIREDFWGNIFVPGSSTGVNQSLEQAGRIEDFLEFAELMIADALYRKESCGSHFRRESMGTSRHDELFCHVACWEFSGVGKEPVLHKEPLNYENIELTQRSCGKD